IYDTILFSNVINVLIVILFLTWLVRRFNLLAFLGNRRNEILETIHNVKEERRIKENVLEKTKLNVKNSDKEVEKIQEEGKEVAETLSRRILRNAELEADDMQKKAQLSIENESRMAKNHIMRTITNSAFAVAEQHIKDTIDEYRHRKYIDDFINKLDNLKV
ncbi:MAG: ATP synthase F0 subunit B, partial [Candidatus Gastranaerophilales bacterium]|nr:ATP synthase F0 subunit B [Candidatus Gastranaerophilales bacterium]